MKHTVKEVLDLFDIDAGRLPILEDRIVDAKRPELMKSWQACEDYRKLIFHSFERYYSADMNIQPMILTQIEIDRGTLHTMLESLEQKLTQ